MQDALGRELESWLGTPWRHRGSVKGLGVDCIHFVALVMHNLGYFDLSKVVVPDYPPDWHLHNTRELLRETLRKHWITEDVPLHKLRTGDVILCNFGRAASHAGIFYDFFWHCPTMGEVCKSSLGDAVWRKRMVTGLRLLK